MKVLISGSTGLIGSALISALATAGHDVVRLVRSAPRADGLAVHWDPESERIDTVGLEGMDAVVHLAGENIGAGRWSRDRKARIFDSRVKGTRLLCESLANLNHPPQVLVCASAIGYYGSRGAEVMNEGSESGAGFLADVCREWEIATEFVGQTEIRVVNLRMGIVLSLAGGPLEKMLPPFKMGVGGILGKGRQYMSWIALDDAVGAIYHTLVTDSLQGPVNNVAPYPVTNREFTKALGRVLRRPTLFPLPSFGLRIMFGREMANELFLSSTRVEPTRLLETGYAFQYPGLEDALRHVLG
jgi:uncharacterized protein (TIGR01777 family)